MPQPNGGMVAPNGLGRGGIEVKFQPGKDLKMEFVDKIAGDDSGDKGGHESMDLEWLVDKGAASVHVTFNIQILKGMSDDDTFGTIMHELWHAKCDLDCIKKCFAEYLEIQVTLRRSVRS